MSHVDPALVSLLSLNAETSSISSAGGGGCSSARTSKLTTKNEDGTTRHYFLKTGKGSSAATMFAGEHLSLSTIHSVVPTLCPQSYAKQANLSPKNSQNSTQHPLPPIPQDHQTPQFGFPLPTCCGDTQQDNKFASSWADFYANHRLRFILSESVRNNGKDSNLSSLVDETCDTVIPNLIGDSHLNTGRGVIPVIVHGDLWSGNTSTGKLPGMEHPEAVVYDSSACYAHSEFELGIMKMFGGFGPKFLDEYHSLVPKTEPVEEYEDRVKLYELYHHLNHYAMFGGSYKSGAMAIMKDLIKKYGGKSEL